MSSAILNKLQELQEPSGKHLDQVAITYIHDNSLPYALVKQVQVANAKWAVVPRNGAASLSQLNNIQSVRKVSTIPAGIDSATTNRLNMALLGGTSYPVLTAVLGVAAGLGSMGAGLLFSALTTGISLTKTSRRVLARAGDEIWHVEEIGKYKKLATYVSSFILVDPYRKQAPGKGWLLHESRDELILS
ncbi:MAG TPA: hypothetical protein ENI64_13635 [Gammaproteobacteria bacterium]|nr:hypothetical protein [Gammaproteobacteria bacterium]